MASEARPSPKPSRLLKWEDILPWQRDNEFILTGYRVASFSFLKSLRSIVQIHNETANIWSHLLGAAAFLWMFTQFFVVKQLAAEIRLQDGIALGLYYLSVAVCFVLSTVFHTFSDHSPGMHKFGNELDHLGVVLVMWASGVSAAHFAFYCHDAMRVSYFVVLTSTALGCAVFTLQPRFRQPAYRTARFMMYCFLGTSLFAPVFHGLWRFGSRDLEGMMGTASFFGLGAVNFTGAAVYAARIPERWFPGRFDLLGQSHNWMHILVLTGALVRLYGLLEVVGRWKETDKYSFCEALAFS